MSDNESATHQTKVRRNGFYSTIPEVTRIYMQNKHIIENNQIVKVRIYPEDYFKKMTEEDFYFFCDKLEKKGYCFLKAIIDNDIKKVFYIKKEDFKKICG